ncbi:MAG: hypothetical protein MK008_08335 [Bdellovibrionales bacterium]|nr:hypothetical protein [Bdellovibrionales bacterium]
MTGFIVLSLSFPFHSARAFWGDGGAGWAQIPYLVKILAENIKRYQQLRMMIDQAQNHDQYFRLINQGLENSIGLVNSLPIKDEEILADLRNFQNAVKTIEEVYGKIPQSEEAVLQLLHDQSVAESLKMVNVTKDYSKKQEENAHRISIQSRQASPKGAARMTAETNAQILHTLNQLLRINGQMLKLQSETLAMNNKQGKDSVHSHKKVKTDMTSSLTGFRGDFSFPKF